MSKDMPTTEIMVSFYDLSEKIQEAVLQNEEFQKLYKDPNAKFDLLISEALHPGMYSLAGRFKVPVIAHPNIKLFVTQGGLQSIEEAILAEVPMIGMPFIGDQAMNVRRIAMLGIGVEEDPSKITETSFRHSIAEVIRNHT
nr:unnamed protein product [Callosobruchus chinensis]